MDLMMRRRALMGILGKKGTPFLTSDGKSLLNTGVAPNSTMKFEYKFIINELKNYGPHLVSSNSVYFPFQRLMNNNMQIMFKTCSKENIKSDTTPLTDNRSHVFHIDNSSVTLDDEQVFTLDGSDWEDSTSLVMFNYGKVLNENLSLNGGFAYFKIWDSNNELIHNFIPAIINGVAGMFDTVTEEFKSSLTNTPFTIEYLEL